MQINDFAQDSKDFSIEAEQSVLGGLVLDNSKWASVNDLLKSSDFSRAEHRLIFDAIKHLSENNQPSDLITIANYLEQKGSLGQAGGLAYIGLLVEHTPSAANVEVYATTVRDRSINRQLKQMISGGKIDHSKIQELLDRGRETPVKTALESIKNFSDLANLELPETTWIVDGLIPEASRNILAAKPKAGKSWLALSLCHAVATGSEFLGRKTNQGNVLYLALEDNERRIIDRVNALNIDFNNNIDCVTADFPSVDKGGLETLDLWCQSVERPRLIVIDTLAKFRPTDSSQNLYQNDYLATQSLLTLTERYGVAVLFVHHTRKMLTDDPLDSISGSLGLSGGVDNLFVLERQGGGSNIGKLSLIGRDLVDDAPISLMFDACTWRVISEAESLVTPDRAQVALLLMDGYEVSEIADILEKRSGTVSKMLHDMAKAGLVERVGKGQYTVCSNISRSNLERVVKDRRPVLSNAVEVNIADDFDTAKQPALPPSPSSTESLTPVATNLLSMVQQHGGQCAAKFAANRFRLAGTELEQAIRELTGAGIARHDVATDMVLLM